MPRVIESIRDSLLKLKVGDTVNFPLHMTTSAYAQMADLRMFDDKTFKGKVDKTRNEIVVRRVQ